MTIAFAVILSVFNAVTFTPALAALLLEKESHAHGRFFTRRQPRHRRRHQRVRAHGRAARCAGSGRWRSCSSLALGATWWVYRAVPGAFVPAEDEGYFITIVQAPSGASIEYTTNIMKEAEQIYFKQPEIAGVFSVAGFSFSGAASNNGLMFARLKDFEEREGAEHSLDAVLNRAARPGVRHSRRARDSGRAAGDSGPLGVRRLPVRSARSDRRRHHRAGRRHAAGGGGRQHVGTRRRAVLGLHGRTTRSLLVDDRSRQARAAWACRFAR